MVKVNLLNWHTSAGCYALSVTTNLVFKFFDLRFQVLNLSTFLGLCGVGNTIMPKRLRLTLCRIDHVPCNALDYIIRVL